MGYYVNGNFKTRKEAVLQAELTQAGLMKDQGWSVHVARLDFVPKLWGFCLTDSTGALSIYPADPLPLKGRFLVRAEATFQVKDDAICFESRAYRNPNAAMVDLCNRINKLIAMVTGIGNSARETVRAFAASKAS